MSYTQPTLSALAAIYPDHTRENLRARVRQNIQTIDALALKYGVSTRTLTRTLDKLNIREEITAALAANREATK